VDIAVDNFVNNSGPRSTGLRRWDRPLRSTRWRCPYDGTTELLVQVPVFHVKQSGGPECTNLEPDLVDAGVKSCPPGAQEAPTRSST